MAMIVAGLAIGVAALGIEAAAMCNCFAGSNKCQGNSQGEDTLLNIHFKRTTTG